MKEQVQSAGVRQWFGDDYINLQNEINTAITSIIDSFGSCILTGCMVANESGNNVINNGVVYLKDATGANGKFCRVNKTTITTFPCYLVQRKLTYPEISAYGRQYKDSNVKPIIEEYRADVVFVQPQHQNYIEIVNDNVVNSAISFKALAMQTPTQLLEKIKTVDGTGSGLDADTTRGIAFTIHGISGGGGGGDVFLSATENGQNFNLPANSDAFLSSILGVDGTGSGIDADKVDGIHFRINSGAFEYSLNGTTWVQVSMSASDILTALLTVDGTGSGLDADKLDGKESATTATADTVAVRDANGALTVTDIIIA
jgi:hypothetical protein